MFYVKEHKSGAESVLAVCDNEVLGKTLEEGELCFTVSEGFYGGTLTKADDVVSRMREAANINLVGDRVVDLAIEHKLVSESNVLKIGGISHAMIVVI